MKMMARFLPLLMLGSSLALVPTTISKARMVTPSTRSSSIAPLFSSDNNNDDGLGEKFGGYTVKQRLREEVESPFRTVRLLFFGTSTGSAFLALYFSATNALKASMGTFSDAQSMEEALTNCAVNVLAVIVCATLTYRDYQAGQANLARIAKGGALARLAVSPANAPKTRPTLKDYRRTSRVLIAAGGKEYISQLARSLNSDQLADENTLPAALTDVDVVVVPVLLEPDERVGDTRSCWLNTVPEEGDRNFDIERANDVVALPVGNGAWTEYLESELETAKTQGFDVLNKGFTITVKKNGKILRRATGQPQWEGLVGAMEVMDGSKFGMPGDSEKYGGP